MKQLKIRKHLVLTVIVSFYILMLALYFVSEGYIESHAKVDSMEKLNSINGALLIQKEELIKEMTSSAFIVQNDKELSKIWLSKDRASLLKQHNKYFDKLFNKSNNSLFNFIDKEGYIVFSANNDTPSSNKVTSYSLNQAMESQIIISGFEIDSLGIFSLRVVVPWFINGNIEGYMELGGRVDKIIGNLHKIFDFEFALLTKKKNIKLLDDDFSRQKNDTNEKLKHLKYISIIQSTTLSAIEIETFLNSQEMFQKYNINDKVLLAKTIVIRDSENEEIAKMVLLNDYTEHKLMASEASTQILYISLIIGLMLFLFLYFYAGHIERKLLSLSEKAISENKLRELEKDAHIKELEKDKEKLELSEKKFRVIFENAQNAITWVNPKTGLIINCNNAAVHLFKYSKDELIGKPRNFLFPKEKEDYYLKKYSEHFSKHTTMVDEAELETKNGKLITVQISASVISVEGSEIIQGTFIDITTRKLNEERIKESEERFNQVAKSTKSVIWEVDENFNFIYLSSSFAQVLGYSQEDLMGKSIFENFYSSIESRKAKSYIGRSVLKSGEFHNLESRFLKEDGKMIFISTSGFVVRDKDGKGLKYIGFTRDITEIKEAESKILESEKRFNEVTKYSNSIVWEIDEDKKYIYINNVVEKILGFKPIELIGQNGYLVFVDCEENTATLTKQKHLLDVDGTYQNLEFKLKHKNGNYVWVRSSGALIYNRDGEVIGRRGISTDITEKKKNLEKIKLSEEKNRSILEALPDILFVFNKNGVFLDYHSRSGDDLVTPPEAFLGKSINEVFPPNIADITMENITKTLSTNEMNIFRYSLSLEDKIYNEEARMVRYSSDKVMVMVRDITDVLEAENKLVEAKERAEKADKLKSTFLAQMSHEIRTPVNSIVSLSSIVEEVLSEHADEELTTCFNLIKNSGDRIVRTIDLILNLSEIEAGTYEVINDKFNLADEILQKLFNEYSVDAEEKNIEIELEANLENPIIKADSYTVEQIFGNLINNAIKYCDKGKIIIRAFNNEKNRVTVEIIDTGIGISEEYLPKLFSSFSQEIMGYTRKYEGNGIGLALVEKYCDLNNATIEVESKRGIGSTFRVTFL